jgi:WD40 repeat protein
VSNRKLTSPNGPKKTAEQPAAGNKAENERIQRWRWMLEQNVPLIGGWMHRRITSALTESALSGNWLATQSLAVVHVFHQEEEVRHLAGQTLSQINYTNGIDAVWGVWAETRHTGLQEIALSYNRPAGHPASVRLLSALCMDSANAITQGGADLVPALIQACSDEDPTIAERARHVILHLRNQPAIDAVCRAWQASRDPFLSEVLQRAGYVAAKPAETRLLSALKINRLELVMRAGADLVAPLVAACRDTDPEVAARALQCLPLLNKPAAVDEFCRIWSETRGPFLETALLQANYRPQKPESVRLLTALKTGRLVEVENSGPEGLDTLLDAVHNADQVIRQNALLALGNLQNEQTRDALCTRVIGAGAATEAAQPEKTARQMETAHRIAMEHGYAPSQAEQRALFFFLTEQWEKYDALDFDQRILRAVYEASPKALRQRISARVQSAGRTEYLTILAGVDYRARAERVSAEESDLLVRILAENREYERLWRLAPELALSFSLRIIKILSEAAWQPSDESGQVIFSELVALSQQSLLIEGPELARALPLAIARSTLKVKGRVNEVAFSPTKPLLAIATSQRKVVLWNFQNATVNRVLEDFQHPVGKVRYMPDGTLAVGERGGPQSLCTVYIWSEEEPYRLCHHEGSVTAMEPVNEQRLLTTGRDGKVALWDLESRRIISTRELSFWARSAAISPDQQYAALLHDRLALVRLPDLSVVPGYPFITPRSQGFKPGVAQNAAFSPDGRYLLSGQYNGQVGLYYHTSRTQRPSKAVVTRHSQPVRGIHFLPGHPLVVTAGAEGQVRFIQWPDMSMQGMVYSPEGQLTSLRVSDQGSFMATGTNEASLVLWDLRVLGIPNLFAQPLATASHDQISNVMALSEYHALPDSVRSGLRFLRLLLQYRFRYDIQIEEAPIIRYGEFDILLDEL